MKQLKDRFRKWGVRKYISDADMTIMLSLVSSTGLDTGFEYKGQPVPPERIQRALRRRKGKEHFAPPACEIYPVKDISGI